MTLTIADRWSGPFHVVELGGDIDIDTARDLRSHFIDRIAYDSSRVVVDLTNVEFVDSSGLGALISGWHITRDKGEFRLAGANVSVQRVLTITGMHDVFQLYPTVSAATTE